MESYGDAILTSVGLQFAFNFPSSNPKHVFLAFLRGKCGTLHKSSYPAHSIQVDLFFILVFVCVVLDVTGVTKLINRRGWMTEEGGLYMGKLLIGLSVVVAGAMLLRAAGRLSTPAYTQVSDVPCLWNLYNETGSGQWTNTTQHGHYSSVCYCSCQCTEELYSNYKVNLFHFRYF